MIFHHAAASALQHSFAFLWPHYVITNAGLPLAASSAAKRKSTEKDKRKSTEKEKASSKKKKKKKGGGVESSDNQQSERRSTPRQLAPVDYRDQDIHRRLVHPIDLTVRFSRQPERVSQSQESQLTQQSLDLLDQTQNTVPSSQPPATSCCCYA